MFPAAVSPTASRSAERTARHGEPMETRLEARSAGPSDAGPQADSAAPAVRANPAARPPSSQRRPAAARPARAAARARARPIRPTLTLTANPSPASAPAPAARNPARQARLGRSRGHGALSGPDRPGEHRDGRHGEDDGLAVHVAACHQDLEQQRVGGPQQGGAPLAAGVAASQAVQQQAGQRERRDVQQAQDEHGQPGRRAADPRGQGLAGRGQRAVDRRGGGSAGHGPGGGIAPAGPGTAGVVTYGSWPVAAIRP